jgi:hypothetical protein
LPNPSERELRDQGLRDLVLSVLRDSKPSSVGELVDSVIAKGVAGTRGSDVIRAVRELRDEGRIDLSERPPAFGGFGAYLGNGNASLSFWLVLIATALTWASIYVVPPDFPWVIARWALGTLFVIFLPGYAFIEALFVNPISGKRELDQIERFALSIGMSLALVPLVGLLLNYTPWGIRLEPIVICLTALTIACIIVAAYRRFGQLSAAVKVPQAEIT